MLHGGNQATKAEAKEMARAGTLSTTTDFIILAKSFNTVIIFFFKIKNIIIIIIVIIKIVDLHAIIILKVLTTMILLPSRQEV